MGFDTRRSAADNGETIMQANVGKAFVLVCGEPPPYLDRAPHPWFLDLRMQPRYLPRRPGRLAGQCHESAAGFC